MKSFEELEAFGVLRLVMVFLPRTLDCMEESKRVKHRKRHGIEILPRFVNYASK